MSDSLRILLSIHHELNPDTGAPGSTLAVADAYSQLGHDVRLLSFDDLPVRLPHKAAMVAYPPFVAMRLAREARRGVDVIDASTGDTWVWATLTRKSRRPLLVTCSHGLEHLSHQRILERADREGERLSWRYHLYWARWRLMEIERSFREADLVFVLNDAERAFLTERLGIAPERVCLTANGLPDSFLNSAPTVNRTGGHTAVAYVGNYRIMKGVKFGARALAGAMNSHSTLTASFFGTGVPRETVLADFPPELHERIATVERYERSELPRLLEGHGILLFPSLSEGFSVSFIEAMACGLAPVATAIPATMQVISPGENGLLVPPADAEELERGLNRLLDDPSLLSRLRQKARSAALGYSWSRIAAERIERYREALERRSR